MHLPYPLRKCWHRGLDLLFPRNCVSCHDLVDNEAFSFICQSCLKQLEWIEEPHCTRCAYPFYGTLLDNRTCPHCTELQPVFERGKSIFLLKGPGKRLIHTLKYEDGVHLAQDLRRMLASRDALAGYFEGGLLIPVPLTRRKLRERGFNQSAIIAEQISQLFGNKIDRNLLKRPKETQSQVRLDKAERAQNVKNAFAIQGEITINSRQRYILIDDVFTTGATLNASAKALKKAGAEHIDIFTMAHG